MRRALPGVPGQSQGCQLAAGCLVVRWCMGKVAWQKIMLLNSSCSRTAVLSWYGLISVWLFQLLFGSQYPFLCNSPPWNSEILTTYIFTKQVRIKQAGCCFLCSVAHFKPRLADSRQWILAGSLHFSHQHTSANVELLKTGNLYAASGLCKVLFKQSVHENSR